MTVKHEIVSFDDEKLILVDENDHIVGYETKEKCHNGDGLLHRAFSIFIFNSKNELLLQKRHPSKRLWGNYWSNTCCSHPRKGENYQQATLRRLDEEVGLKTPLTYLYKFQYFARFQDKGAENELCSVYIGKSDKTPQINETEIIEWKWISIDDLNKEMEENPDQFTPWFKMEWERLMREYKERILNLPADPA